jgi:hypothetical protein
MSLIARLVARMGADPAEDEARTLRLMPKDRGLGSAFGARRASRRAPPGPEEAEAPLRAARWAETATDDTDQPRARRAAAADPGDDANAAPCRASAYLADALEEDAAAPRRSLPPTTADTEPCEDTAARARRQTAGDRSEERPETAAPRRTAAPEDDDTAPAAARLLRRTTAQQPDDPDPAPELRHEPPPETAMAARRAGIAGIAVPGFPAPAGGAAGAHSGLPPAASEAASADLIAAADSARRPTAAGHGPAPGLPGLAAPPRAAAGGPAAPALPDRPRVQIDQIDVIVTQAPGPARAPGPAAPGGARAVLASRWRRR